MEPKIRLKGFQGGWKESAFSESFDSLKNNSLSRAELDDSGTVYNIHYGDVLIAYNECVKIDKEVKTFVKNAEVARKLYHSCAIKNGDVIFADAAEDNTVGKCTEVIAQEADAIVSGLHTIPYRPKKEFASRYLGYYLNSKVYHDQLLPHIQGTKISSISKRALAQTHISYPSDKNEQQAIASYFQHLDSLIQSTTKKIESLKQVKAASLQTMLPREGETTPRVRFKGFEGEWKSVTLGEIAEMQSGGTPSSHNSEYYNGNIPFLSITDMTNAGKYINSTIKSITEYGLANSSTRIYPAGTLMYAMYASLGKCSITNIDVAISQAILGFSLSNEIDREFLYQYLCNIESGIKCFGQTGTQTNLSKSIVEKFNILIPTLSEQKLVGNLLSSLDSQISLQTQCLEKLKQIKSACLDNMFV